MKDALKKVIERIENDSKSQKKIDNEAYKRLLTLLSTPEYKNFTLIQKPITGKNKRLIQIGVKFEDYEGYTAYTVVQGFERMLDGSIDPLGVEIFSVTDPEIELITTEESRKLIPLMDYIFDGTELE